MSGLSANALGCGTFRFQRALQAEQLDGAKQRRRRQSVASCVATRGQEGENIALLLARGVRDGHQIFGERIAAITLGTEGALAPKNEGANLSLSVIVGRLDASLINEGPQSCSVL